MSGEQPVPAYDPTQGSVGIVQTQYFTFDELRLDSGARLGPVTLAYETYGRLNERRDNAVLVLHALSGDAHVAGWHSPQDRYPGWWDSFVGPGKGLDTDRYFVICSNVIGGCKGSTGPSSIDPRTGRPYAMRFPVVTIGDMVRAQARLIDRLGIERLLAVIGGSMGGMQALQWAVDYPERVAGLIPIASCMRLSALGIAFNEVGRRAIMIDPAWRDGDYYDGEPPADGLGLARMIGHVTYLSEASMAAKFGRRLRNRDRYGFDFGIDFEVESYLRYQGERFVQRFDANSYLYITKAMDYFDLTRGEMTPAEAMAPVQARTLVVSVTSDWLYPSAQSEEIAEALRAHGKPVQHRIINSDYGHDSFLLETPWLTREVGDFLAELHADLQR